MDWGTVATAGFGLGAGLVGAGVQYLLGERAQRRRDLIETARLNDQLSAQATEADANRSAADLLDWRSRRIDAYRSVTASATQLTAVCNNLNFQLAFPDVDTSIPYVTDGDVDRAMQVVRDAVGEALLISDAQLRDRAEALRKAAQAITDSSVRLLYASQRQQIPEDPEHESARIAWSKASEALRDSLTAWVEGARRSLGVPD